MPVVAIDARMIRHSGIGAVLRGLVGHWLANPPAFSLLLCGDPEGLGQAFPSITPDQVARWTPPVYSLSAAMRPPRPPQRIDAWYSPHYATCLRPGVPLVCHVQDILHITHPTRRGSRLYNRIYLNLLRRRAAFCLTTTRHVKVQLQTLLHFRPDRVLCTGLGPGLDFSQAGSLPPELDGKQFYLAVGIYKRHKNWDFLLENMAKVLPDDAWFAAAGTGKSNETITELARKHGLRRFIALPHLDEASMAATCMAAEALVHASCAEGFGLPVLEAMSAGTPIILADRAPMREIARDSALLFDPEDGADFARAFKQFLTDTDERARLCENGKRRACLYTWRRTARHIEDALLRAMGSELPPPPDDRSV